jgi:hypothetical protein
MKEHRMQVACEIESNSGPKQKDRRRYSYDEDVDEPTPLIERESTDIEKEIPADDTEPVERVKNENGQTPAAFEE